LVAVRIHETHFARSNPVVDPEVGAVRCGYAASLLIETNEYKKDGRAESNVRLRRSIDPAH